MKDCFSLISARPLKIQTKSKGSEKGNKRGVAREERSIKFDHFSKFKERCDDKLKKSFDEFYEIFLKQANCDLSKVKAMSIKLVNGFSKKKIDSKKDLELINKELKINLRKGEDEMAYYENRRAKLLKKIGILSDLKKYENFIDDLYKNVDNSDNFFKAMQNKEHQESLELFLQTINNQKFERQLPCLEIRGQMIKNFEAIENRYIKKCLEKEKGRTA
ncbi:MAG: hypothetical protein ACO201_04420 [Rickettsiales bacterium]